MRRYRASSIGFGEQFDSGDFERGIRTQLANGRVEIRHSIAMERTDTDYMRHALVLAREAAAAGDVPVGAVVARGGSILCGDANRTVRDQDPTAHAELLAIRRAARELGRWRLDDCTLYVTLEPCAMCAGAIVLARLSRVVFGAWDDKAGMAGSVGDLLRHPRLNHRPEVSGGIMAAEAGEMLTTFFRDRRLA